MILKKPLLLLMPLVMTGFSVKRRAPSLPILLLTVLQHKECIGLRRDTKPAIFPREILLMPKIFDRFEKIYIRYTLTIILMKFSHLLQRFYFSSLGVWLILLRY